MTIGNLAPLSCSLALGLVFSALLAHLCHAQGVGVRLSPLSDEIPSFLAVHNILFPSPAPFWGAAKAPYPTNIWWTNLAFDSFPLVTYPYLQTPTNNSLSLCVPTYNASNTSFTSGFSNQLTFWNNLLDTRRVLAYDRLGAVVEFSSSSLGVDGPVMRVPFVQGSPFATIMFQGRGSFLNFTTTEGFAITSINNDAPPAQGGTVVSRKLVLQISSLNTNDPAPPPPEYWVIYSLNGYLRFMYFTERLSPERATRDRFIISANATDWTTLRIAYLATPGVDAEFDPFAAAIVLGGDVTVNYSGENPPATASIKFAFNVVDGFGNPFEGSDVLMYALPHHLDSLDLAQVSEANVPLVPTSRGNVTGLNGTAWYFSEPLTNITWTAPRPPDSRRVQSIAFAVKSDVVKLLSTDNDTYSTGKFVSALARLALIADELNLTTHRDNALRRLDDIFSRWMNRVTYRDTFLYDLTYGSVISANGWTDKFQDFGNVLFNDHHYHNGYYIYAGAVLLRFNASYPYRQQIIDLVRDIANPSTADPYFPVTRHKDWYLGHSWAQGMDATFSGKNQESTSEAVNAYYAMSLAGVSLGNSEMRDLGRLLLATEIRSVQKYYHMMPDSAIYPPIFAQNGCVGILWSDKADYSTFFGQRTEYIHGIQMMPFTPVSESLLDREWMAVDYQVLKMALVPDPAHKLEEQWRALIVMAQAIVDRDGAWTRALILGDDAFKAGNSKSNVLYWIATRPS